MSEIQVSEQTKKAVRQWMEPQLFDFFFEVCLVQHRNLFGFMEDGFPHLLHQNEGMALRNLLRQLPLEEGGIHDFDTLENHWINILFGSLELTKEQCETIIKSYNEKGLTFEEALTSNDYGTHVTAKLVYDYCIEKGYHDILPSMKEAS